MNPEDKKAFAHAFNRLAKSGLIHDIDTATMAIFFEAMLDLPLWAVERAELHLRRHPVKFFTSAEWHARAAEILREQRRHDQRVLADQKLLLEQCSACRDTGWRASLLDENRVVPCPCRDTNQNYLANRAREAVVAEGRPDHPSPEEAAAITQRIGQGGFKQLGSGE